MRRQQQANFEKACEELSVRKSESAADRLKECWRLGQRAGEILGIFRNPENGSIYSDPRQAVEQYGAKSIAWIVEQTGVTWDEVVLAIQFFSKCDEKLMKSMVQAIRLAGCDLFPRSALGAALHDPKIEAEVFSQLVHAAIEKRKPLKYSQERPAKAKEPGPPTDPVELLDRRAKRMIRLLQRLTPEFDKVLGAAVAARKADGLPPERRERAQGIAYALQQRVREAAIMLNGAAQKLHLLMQPDVKIIA